MVINHSVIPVRGVWNKDDAEIYGNELEQSNEELYEKIVQGILPESAVSTLADRLRGMIFYFAKGYIGLNGMDEDDLFQEAVILLLDIIRHRRYCTEDERTAFASFFAGCWKRRLLHMYRDYVLHNPVKVGFRVRWEGKNAIYEDIESFKTTYIERYRDREIVRNVMWKAKKKACETLLMSPYGGKLRETSVAIYLRDYSTDYRTNIRKQSKMIGELVKRHPEWTQLRVYIDYSVEKVGKQMEDQLSQMLCDADENLFSILVVKSRSVLSRRTTKANTLIEKLKMKHIETIVLEDENNSKDEACLPTLYGLDAA